MSNVVFGKYTKKSINEGVLTTYNHTNGSDDFFYTKKEEVGGKEKEKEGKRAEIANFAIGNYGVGDIVLRDSVIGGGIAKTELGEGGRENGEKERKVNEQLRKNGFTTVRRQGREGDERYIGRLYDALLSVMAEYEKRAQLVQDMFIERPGRKVKAIESGRETKEEEKQIAKYEPPNIDDTPFLSSVASPNLMPVLIPVTPPATPPRNTSEERNKHMYTATKYKQQVAERNEEIIELREKSAQLQHKLAQQAQLHAAQEMREQQLREHLRTILENEKKIKEARKKMYDDLVGKGIRDSRIEAVIALLEEQRRSSKQEVATLNRQLNEQLDLSVTRARTHSKAIEASKSKPALLPPPSVHSKFTQCELPRPPQVHRAVQCQIILDQEQWPLPNNLLLCPTDVFYNFAQ